MIIKYTKAVYEQKISTLEGDVKELEGHLNTLEGFKNQIPNFWEGETAAKWVNVIGEEILHVNRAMQECKNLRHTYQGIVDDLSKTTTAIDEVVDDVTAAVKAVITLGG